MRKNYNYKNGIVCVFIPDKCDREELRKATEEFLKKVIARRNK